MEKNGISKVPLESPDNTDVPDENIKDSIERHYRSLVESSEDSIYMVDTKCRYLFINSRHLIRMEMSPPCLIGKRYDEFHSPEESTTFEAAIRRVCNQKTPIQHEHESMRDGKTFLRTLSPVLEKDGAVKAITVISKDISHLKHIEQTLKESKARYELIFENFQDSYYEIDGNGIIREISPSIGKILGYKREDVIGKPIINFYHDHTQRLSFLEHLHTKGELRDYEITFKEKSGKGVPCSISAVIILQESGDTDKIIGSIRNISERKRLDREREERRRYIEGVFSAVPNAIITENINRRIVEWNAAAERLFGYTRDEVIGKNLDSLVNYRDQGDDNISISEALLLDEVIRPREVIRYRKDGSTIAVRVAGSPIRMDGEVIGCVVVYTDISEQKKAKENLHREKEKFRLMMEESPLGVMIASRAKDIYYLNPAFVSISGFSASDVSTLDEFLKKFLKTKIRQETFLNLIDETTPGKPRSTVFNITTRNKEKKTLYFRHMIMEKGDHFFIAEDITENRRLQDQLQRAQKMEAIGTLAGGIAHDFNNLLMGIQGNASLGLMQLDISHPCHERIKNIEKLVTNGSELTKQLLGFARQGRYETKETNINKFIENSTAIFGRTKKEIQIFRNYAPDIFKVTIDRSQMEQVFLNLFVNASQAMPSGGNLYLATANVRLDKKYAKPYSVKPGHYVKVSITDTGTGMDKATMDRIFDPFFTTKEMGHGTGLGLASVYGIVQNHHGIINVYSEKGVGTTFNIYLPASGQSIKRSKKNKQNNDPPRGRETILLVDDEQMIIDIGKDILEALGYTVIAVRNGSDAISTYQQHGEAIDLVILDMIMPAMDGEATFDALKAVNPQVTVLLSSGYSINGRAEAIMQKGCRGFIQKPFTFEEAARTIRRILDDKPTISQ